MDKAEVLRMFFELGREARETLGKCEKPDSLSGKNPQGDDSLKIDIELENIVKDKIGGNHTLITEERPEKGNGGDIFILDPLDGSENFKRGVPAYAFAVCMAPEGSKTIRDIEVSYVLDLVTGDEYHAVRGGGAYLNRKKISCKGSGKVNLISVDLGCDSKNASELMGELMKLGWIRNFGPCVMHMCMVAKGSLDAFVDVRDSILVTHAAPLLILKEAGASVTDKYGREVVTPLAQGAKFDVVASNNPQLHNKILGAIRSAGIGD